MYLPKLYKSEETLFLQAKLQTLIFEMRWLYHLNRIQNYRITSYNVCYTKLLRMAFYGVKPDPAYLKYAIDWGESHKWGLRGGIV